MRGDWLAVFLDGLAFLGWAVELLNEDDFSGITKWESFVDSRTPSLSAVLEL